MIKHLALDFHFGSAVARNRMCSFLPSTPSFDGMSDEFRSLRSCLLLEMVSQSKNPVSVNNIFPVMASVIRKHFSNRTGMLI